MGQKNIFVKDNSYGCPCCGYRWKKDWELAYNEDECVPCCPECGELIEDGEDGSERTWEDGGNRIYEETDIKGKKVTMKAKNSNLPWEEGLQNMQAFFYGMIPRTY